MVHIGIWHKVLSIQLRCPCRQNMASNTLVLMIESTSLLHTGTHVAGMDVMQGVYDEVGDHNGKPMYRHEVNGCTAVIYFSDAPWYPGKGWRCGPACNEFWVFSKVDSPTPPSNGWFAKDDLNLENILAISMGGLICPFKLLIGVPVA